MNTASNAAGGANGPSGAVPVPVGSSGGSGLVLGGPSPSAAASSWAQAAGKSLQSAPGANPNDPATGPSLLPSSGSNLNSSNPTSLASAASASLGALGNNPPPPSGPSTVQSSNVTSKQMEQLNSMREALFSHDGWGGTVNQDSRWDVPGSPEPSHKDIAGISQGAVGSSGSKDGNSGFGSWKPSVMVNNGTDLWEANLRNGGAPPAQPTTQKVPWSHTPSSHHGGTWGEEDEVDSSNVWNGMPQPNSSSANNPNNQSSQNAPNLSNDTPGGVGGRSPWMAQPPPQQQQQMQSQQPPLQLQREPQPTSSSMWPNSGPLPQQQQQQQQPMKEKSTDWASGGPSNMGGVGMSDRPSMLGRGMSMSGMDGNNSMSSSNWGNVNSNISRGGMNNGPMDPSPGMWNKPQQQQQPQQSLPPPHIPQWNNNPGMGVGHMGQGVPGPKEKSGWDDLSPPAQRRNVPSIPNYDDGTSLWGTPMPGQQMQQQQQPNRGGMLPPNRGIQGGGGGPKPMDNNNMWGGASGGNNNNRNGWQNQVQDSMPQQQQQRGGFSDQLAGGWNDNSDKLGGGWNDPPMAPMPMQQQHDINNWGQKPKTPTQGGGAGGWGSSSGGVDDVIDTWGSGAQNKSQHPHPHQKYGNSSSLVSPHNPNNGIQKELYWNTKTNVLKILADSLGYSKKDDGSSSSEGLVSSNRAAVMHLNDAIDNLDLSGIGVGPGPRGMNDMSSWDMGGGPQMQHPSSRRPPIDPYDMSGGLGIGGGPMNNSNFMGQGQGRGGQQQQQSGNSAGGFNPNMNSMLGNPNVGGMNPMVQSILNRQQQQPQQPFSNPTGRVQSANNQQPGPPPNPSSTQLRMLVSQIQMAVQAGYLNAQILQQPLPQTSLLLLNQLLNHIKVFQQLTQAQHQMAKTNNPNVALKVSMQLQKAKQTINQLHDQILAQQNAHSKEQQQQQQQQHHHQQRGNPSNDFYKSSPMSNPNSSSLDPMLSQGLPRGFEDFGLNKDPSGQGPVQTSRLTQWTKVPSSLIAEKDDAANEFSRAPGNNQQQSGSGGMLKNHSNLMLGQNDNTWSTGANVRSGSDGWPSNESNVAVNSQPDDSKLVVGNDFGSFGDLVPEFEPGKPWKGTQIMKSVEDDPTITPGSVVRSPLSLATIKDSEIFNKSSSSANNPTSSSSNLNNPGELTTPISLSSNTWSFTPSAGTNTMANSMSKLPQQPSQKSWEMDNSQQQSSQQQQQSGRLWDYGGGQGSGGSGPNSRPPPGMGLPQKQSQGNMPGNYGGSSSNTLPNNVSSFNNATTYRPQNNNNSTNSVQQQQSTGGWGSRDVNNSGHYWLLLRNLTPQIDGSTLKTLCLQHGPLTKFHLYLNHGLALVKYSNRDEAPKAQASLNNCVLGNTTILAETANETEVFNLMSGLNGGNGGGNNAQQQPTSNNTGFGNPPPVSKTVVNNENPWSSSSSGMSVHRDNSPLWSTNTNSPWGSSSMSMGMDQVDRSTPSSLNNLLPGDLLGGESA